ncbi:MAG: flagellar motor protein MotB [Lachnospiraceae bacterium]|nr:flagellar motor protein MotB [Lachnospiraceae bacterium]
MAKNKEQQEIKTDGWKDTFSDLMNLLLCFFVLLYSMSVVDEVKFAELVASLSNSYSIFSGGAQAIGEGTLVSSGATQLNNLDDYYSDMGKQAEDTENPEDPMKELEAKQAAEKRDEVEKIYADVVEATENKRIEDDLDVTIDDGNNYVMLSLNGSVLFESGSAEIQSGAKTILSRVSDILNNYRKNRIKIEGHTDNVAIHTAEFPSNVWLSTARATKVLEYFNSKGLPMKNMEASGRGDVEPIATNKTKAGRAKNRRVEIKIYGLSSN